MTIKIDLQNLLAQASKFKPDNPTNTFIREVTFTKFKNIEPGTRLKFNFPVTAIVGANGSGKSSILHALWGMPFKKSTSRFWFSTPVDQIEDGGDKRPVSYWYSHWVSKLKMFVETRKVMGPKRHGYWEPARALTRDGMAPMPAQEPKTEEFRSKQRWNPAEREVEYINFKAEFSAFDRFFYFEDGLTLDRKQDLYVDRATRLKRVIEARLESYSPGGRQAVYENRELTEVELDWIGFILGREYISAQYIRHRLLGVGESPTVVFRRKSIQYSEAAAGSGELAVVQAVIRLLACKPNTLVLLDEPETSLHPGAQKNLLAFLLEMWRTKQLQIVMSTHSPTLVEMLPTRAISLLEETVEGKSAIVEVSHPHVAFNRLGHLSSNKLIVAVEDELLRRLVELAMELLDPGEQESISLYVPPGGASSILANDIPVWIHGNQNAYAILDGDQKSEAPNLNAMTQDDLAKLPSTLKDRYGVIPMHVGNDQEQAQKYVRWVSDRLRYLDAVCPEYVLLENLRDGPLGDMTNEEAKAAFIAEMKKRSHKTDADSLVASVSFILKEKGLGNTHISNLVLVLKGFLSHHAQL